MKKNNGKSYLLIGLILIFVGILTLIGSVRLFRDVANLAIILIILITIKDLCSFLVKKPSLDLKLFIRIMNVILAIFAYMFNEYSIAIVPIIFSIYLLLNAAGYFINFAFAKLSKTKGQLKYFFTGLIYLIVGVMLLFKPIINLGFMLNIIGIYSILLGFTFIFDYLEINHYRKFPKFRLCLPTIIEAIIPITALNFINKSVNLDEEIIEVKKENIDTDLEIFIHVTKDGYGRLGHIDMCFEGEMIAFGNYDKSTYRFYDLFGTGVFFMTKKKKEYIKWCIEDNKKILFSFGIKLTNKEKERLREELNRIKLELKEWYPPCIVDKKNKNKHNDYASRLYKATKANFYKFKKHKEYFILGDNCVTFINKILSKSLQKKFQLYGFMTPGTYYDYLEREYLKKNSIVVSKKIYSKANLK